MQVPVQVLSQQTPSTQWPSVHSPSLLQAAPTAFRHSSPVVLIHVPSAAHTWGVVPLH
jgi:hypothetical protein